MDNQDREPMRDAIEIVLGAYAYIAKILGGLPIPIRVPEVAEGWTMEIGCQAVSNARELIKSLPLAGLAPDLLDKLLLQWLTVTDLCGVAHAFGTEGWRLDAIEQGLALLATTGQLAELALDDDRE